MFKPSSKLVFLSVGNLQGNILEPQVIIISLATLPSKEIVVFLDYH
jgi:hypothetical protein